MAQYENAQAEYGYLMDSAFCGEFLPDSNFDRFHFGRIPNLAGSEPVC